MKCLHCGKTIITCEECRFWRQGSVFNYYDGVVVLNDKGKCTNKKIPFGITTKDFSCAEGEFK
jgi:hypothetical protein